MYSFTPEKPLFGPEHVVKPIPGWPKTAVVTWQQPFLKYVRRMNLKQVWQFTAGIKQPVYTFDFRGRTFGFAVLGLGGPIVSSFMEEMAIHGTENFVFIGSCGALSDELETGIVVPDRAYRDEGTSWHYIPSQEEAIDIPTAGFTSSFLASLGFDHERGGTWTTDAIYRETPSAAAYYRGRGCLTVEMECASIMAVAQYRSLNAFQILFTADSLANDTWKKGRLFSMEENAWETYMSLASALALAVETSFRKSA